MEMDGAHYVQGSRSTHTTAFHSLKAVSSGYTPWQEVFTKPWESIEISTPSIILQKRQVCKREISLIMN